VAAGAADGATSAQHAVHEAYTFGFGAHGRLGHGDTGNRERPTLLLGCTLATVSCGVNSSAGVDVSGAVFTWGRVADGTLGHGDSKNKLVPTKVRGMGPEKGVFGLWVSGPP
jgi:E3 ubiquitin-protein ligase HERC2